MDLKQAAMAALPEGRHFTLVEAVAQHICDTLMAGDARVRRVRVDIVKLASAVGSERFGVSLTRALK